MYETPATGATVEINGVTYFVVGNTRIKVTEHFAPNGKPLPDLLEDVIRYAAGHNDTS